MIINKFLAGPRRGGLQVIVSFLLLLFSVTCTLSTVYAADEPCKDKVPFTTSYDVTYDVSEDGETLVTEKVSLKNLTSECYASQFRLTIGATQISDVKASDESGPIETKAQTLENSTVIDVKFNSQVAGLGKILPWTLSFKSKDFAEKTGKIWEIRAPKISSAQNLESYNLTMSVPQNFGEPTAITPVPKSQTISGGRMFLTFSKDQLTGVGISASFGTNQLFDFDLSYHLENNKLVPILTNISLPPDSAYQDVIYQRIEPKPINVTVDDDGNYLAWYRLERGAKIDVKAIGSAKLYTSSKVKNPILSEDSRIKYTQPDKYWEKDNPAVVAKLAEILGSNTSVETEEKAKLIFRYVVGVLKYDPSRLTDNIERLGAVTALNNPTSVVCMEFTDLFIALSRAAGIPARELDGYAYTANSKLRPLSLGKDVLHAWPEYWNDKKGWVMVDPTWENTTGGVDYFSKLDLSHFVFSVKGLSSTQPAPAGSYKYTGQDSKDVKVTLSDVDFLGKPQLDVKVDLGNPVFAGFPTKTRVTISNFGNSFYPSSDLNISAGKLTVLGAEGLTSGPIPAFGTASFDLNLRTKSLFDSYSDDITVLIGGQKFSKQVKVKPFILFQTVPLIAFGIIALMGVLYLTILGVFFYRKRFAKHQPKS